ncbi:hypothetical protein MAR_003443 [Mya arenaria]|uniref:Uncharacterized protein n=1 Tax=Mya arenaria TaxID=6604 RepID=A0ABY7G615_MYAAR|nr:hypothetical protein MAR_003443 [Mya arenaria]
MVSETSFFPTERCVPASLLDDGEILKKAYWLAHNVAMVMFAIPSSVEKLLCETQRDDLLMFSSGDAWQNKP